MKTIYLIEANDSGSTFSSETATDIAFESEALAIQFDKVVRLGYTTSIKKVNIFDSIDEARKYLLSQ